MPISLCKSLFRVISLILLLPSIVAPQTSDSPQTVESLSAYKAQRKCAQGCFWYPTVGGQIDGIANVNNCKTGIVTSAGLDSCWCRPDLQPRAETYLSTCISSSCSSAGGAVSVDVSSAVSIYDNYCLGKRDSTVDGPQSIPATRTETGSIMVTTQLVTVASTGKSKAGTNFSTPSTPSPSNGPSSSSISTTQTTISTSTESSNRGGKSSGDNIGREEIITIIFGILGAVVAISIAVWQGKRDSFLRKRMAGKLDKDKIEIARRSVNGDMFKL